MTHKRLVVGTAQPPMPVYANNGKRDLHSNVQGSLMTSMLVQSRHFAARLQQCKCFYCGAPMWVDNVANFAAVHGLSTRQAAWLQCTAEHLRAKHVGGTASRSNIVAACKYCNLHRHRSKFAPDPLQYKSRVLKRVAQGKWFTGIQRFQSQRARNDA